MKTIALALVTLFAAPAFAQQMDDFESIKMPQQTGANRRRQGPFVRSSC